jgi:hypothetical protein
MVQGQILSTQVAMRPVGHLRKFKDRLDCQICPWWPDEPAEILPTGNAYSTYPTNYDSRRLDTDVRDHNRTERDSTTHHRSYPARSPISTDKARSSQISKHVHNRLDWATSDQHLTWSFIR